MWSERQKWHNNALGQLGSTDGGGWRTLKLEDGGERESDTAVLIRR